MKAAERDPALAALAAKIAQERGFSCEAYKESVLRRRIAVRMRACGVADYVQYAAVLDSDRDEYERLLDALTINVSKFFRNRETWEAIDRDVLPRLLANGEVLRCWSAGCASGEEPYTLAMLVLERAGTDRAHKSPARIDATDLDRVSLARAREGIFSAATLDEAPTALVQRYFVASDHFQVVPAVRSLVEFRQHDILRDPPPQPPYDLILCRNVVIYFDRVSQDHIFGRFIDALRPGGVLILGKVEILFGSARERLILENPRERIYRRP